MAQASHKRTGREYVQKARQTGEKAGRGAKQGILWITAVIVGIAIFLGGVVPVVLEGVLSGGGVLLASVAAILAGMAGWIRTHTDEKWEKGAAFAIVVLGVGGLLVWWSL